MGMRGIDPMSFAGSLVKGAVNTTVKTATKTAVSTAVQQKMNGEEVSFNSVADAAKQGAQQGAQQAKNNAINRTTDVAKNTVMYQVVTKGLAILDIIAFVGMLGMMFLSMLLIVLPILGVGTHIGFYNWIKNNMDGTARMKWAKGYCFAGIILDALFGIAGFIIGIIIR